MPSKKILKIISISFLGLMLIILLFIGLRINSYKIFITSLVDGEKQMGLNKHMTGFATDFPYIYSSGDFGIVVVNVYPMEQYVLFQTMRGLVLPLYHLKMQI